MGITPRGGPPRPPARSSRGSSRARSADPPRGAAQSSFVIYDLPPAAAIARWIPLASRCPGTMVSRNEARTVPGVVSFKGTTAHRLASGGIGPVQPGVAHLMKAVRVSVDFPPTRRTITMPPACRRLSHTTLPRHPCRGSALPIQRPLRSKKRICRIGLSGGER